MEGQKLVCITNKEIINDLRDRKDIIKLYPLKSFCVGYELEFTIGEIDDYVLINRILTNQDLKKLQTILAKAKIKGIVFDDLGVLEVVKDLKITKILMLNHLGNNVISLNYYLEYVDSVIISTDITEAEIAYILNNCHKELVLPVFTLVSLMYSRRQLLTNYANHYHLPKNKQMKVNIKEKYFQIYENEYGTVFYPQKYYCFENYHKYPHVLYYFYNPIFLNCEEILKVLADDWQDLPTTSFLLKQKTIYKIKDGDLND